MISRSTKWLCSQPQRAVAGAIEQLCELVKIGGFDPKDPRITEGLQCVLSRKSEIGLDVFHLLPILKITRNSTAAWKLLSVIETQLNHSSFSQLSNTAWILAKLVIPDTSVWKAMRNRLLSTSPTDIEAIPKYVSRALWGVCNSGDPLHDVDTLALKQWFNRVNLSDYSTQDLVMVLGSLCHLCPKDTPLISEISGILANQLINASLPTCAVVSLWRSAELMQPPPAVLLELLAEQSRTLRLDPAGFTDDACAQVAKAAAVLKCGDPRVMYQLINFMKVNGLKTRSVQFLSLLKSYTKLGIADDVVWKRFAARVEKLGPAWTLKELKMAEKCFYKANKMTPRVNGILQCFVAVKEDIDKYGPS
jgi:hypothetical protein